MRDNATHNHLPRLSLSRAQLTCRIDAVGERLGQVQSADGMRAIEIGDGARQFQHIMKPACRKTQTFGSFAQKGDACRIGPRNLFDEVPRRGGIRADVGQAELSIAARLDKPRRGNARRDFGRAFRRRRRARFRRGGHACRRRRAPPSRQNDAAHGTGAGR